MTRSAVGSNSSMASSLAWTVRTRPAKRSSSSIRRGMERSTIVTRAPMPAATVAAAVPATPPPRTRTSAGATPGTPPISRPRPPPGPVSAVAPACAASRPATSLMGARSGKPSLSVLDRLVGDAARAGLGERQREPRIGREMQVGEQRVLIGQPLDLHGQRLLDLEDELRLERRPRRRSCTRRRQRDRPSPGTRSRRRRRAGRARGGRGG